MRDRLKRIKDALEKYRPRLRLFGADVLLDDMYALLRELVEAAEARK